MRLTNITIVELQLRCCGATGPRDWSKARFNQVNKKSDKGMDLAISSSLQTYKLPLSCCSTPNSPTICDDGSRIGLSANIPVVMYQEVNIFLHCSFHFI